MEKRRVIFYFRTYFDDFFLIQTQKVKDKIIWTLRLIEEVDVVPELYLKHLTGTEGLYEIRVQHRNNIFRIFCFFDKDNLIVLGHGFQKKTDKTPHREIERAKKIKKEYYEQKQSHEPR